VLIQHYNSQTRISQRKIEENLQASKVAALGASLGIVSDILGKNQQLVKQQHLHKLLLILIKVTAGIKLGYPAAIPAVAAATVVLVQLKHC
jgi:hypothetical protein